MSISIHFDTGNLAREEATGLTALLAAVQPTLSAAAELKARYDSPYGQTATALGSQAGGTTAPPVDNDHVAESATAFSDTDVAANAPKRERGQPSPGKARRTKAEIAEDDAAEAADANLYRGVSDQNSAEYELAIAEGRPTPGQTDTAEDAAQDAADEAAEVDAGRDTDAPLTVDDLKDVMGDYVSKFTMEATKEDGPRIFNDALGRPPEGEAAWKASLIAGLGQDHLRKAIAAWKSAAASDDRYSKGA